MPTNETPGPGTASRPLIDEISDVLNRHSAENGSDTPDFILARFLMKCLEAFDEATKLRDAMTCKPSDLKRIDGDRP